MSNNAQAASPLSLRIPKGFWRFVRGFVMCGRLRLPLLMVLANVCVGQSVIPETGQVNLYFPHLADGGPRSQQWQTKLTFVNPNNSAVNVSMNFYSDSGGPLNLNFGSGPVSQYSFTMPPLGSRVFRSRVTSQ